jgi:hypothetical protein
MIEEASVTASRPGRHVARVAVASALVLSMAGLSACSAGQVTQTNTQVAAVPGASGDSTRPDGGPATVGLRDVYIAYSDPKGYPAGGNAPLVVRLFNLTPLPLQLTKVDAALPEADGGGPIGTVVLSGAESAAGDVTASPSPGATESPAVAPPAGDSTFSIDIPGAGYTTLIPGDEPHLQISDLTRPLRPGNLVAMTSTFSDGSTATLNVGIAPPTVPAPRSPMQLEEGESGH